MAKKATSKNKKKKPGRTIANSARRFKYDAAGTRPLTQYPLCPMTIPMLAKTKDDLIELSEQFIAPDNLKPYGVGAVARVLLQIHQKAIDNAPREELIEVFRQIKGLPGRSGFKEAATRTQILIPKHIVDRINARVIALNDPEIGTATCIRWLLVRGLLITTHYQLYKFMPSTDIDYMRKEKLTVDDVLNRYRASQAPAD